MASCCEASAFISLSFVLFTQFTLFVCFSLGFNFCLCLIHFFVIGYCTVERVSLGLLTSMGSTWLKLKINYLKNNKK